MPKGKSKPKTKPEPLEETDGRADHQPNLTKKRTIDEILGTNRKRYTQGNEEEYKAFLKQLNLTDMQVEARDRGLIPITDRKVLEQRLVREFKKTSGRYFGTVVQEQQGTLSETAKRILSAGR